MSKNKLFLIVHASYIDEVVKGKTIIGFIRHKDSPDESLYTVEIDPVTMTVKQFKGMCDKQPAHSAIDFLSKVMQ